MNDRAIIQQVLAGDVEAFAQIVDRHYPRCARIAVRIVGNHEDAEEAVQDAFLRAFKALDDYEDRERFSAWLTRILVNQCPRCWLDQSGVTPSSLISTFGSSTSPSMRTTARACGRSWIACSIDCRPTSARRSC